MRKRSNADPQPAAAQRPRRQPASRAFRAELFYRLLLGDVALQRGDLAVSARAYIDAARSARTIARLAERATEVAIASRERGARAGCSQAVGAARSRGRASEARAGGARGRTQIPARIPSSAANDELRSRIERVLADAALSGPGVGEVFMQLNRLFSQQSDKRAVLSLVRDVAKPYPKTPEAHYAVALAAFGAGEDDGNRAGGARRDRPRARAAARTWERAAILKARDRRPRIAAGRDEGGSRRSSPRIRTAKSARARSRSNTSSKSAIAEARALMQKLWDREPESRDLEFAVATIALQMKDYPEAERLLQRTEERRLRRAGRRSTCTSRRSPRRRGNRRRRSSTTRR